MVAGNASVIVLGDVARVVAALVVTQSQFPTVQTPLATAQENPPIHSTLTCVLTLPPLFRARGRSIVHSC